MMKEAMYVLFQCWMAILANSRLGIDAFVVPTLDHVQQRGSYPLRQGNPRSVDPLVAQATTKQKETVETNVDEDLGLYPPTPIPQHETTTMGSRRLFLGTTLVTTSSLLWGGASMDPAFAAAAATAEVDYSLPWTPSPVNKRSGVKILDAEAAGYNVAFVTYLSRILLNFDTNCQRWWYSSTPIPSRATGAQVEEIRRQQFARFSASVEVGLLGFTGPEGSALLLQDLVRKYGTPSPSSSEATSARTNTTTTTDAASISEGSKSQRRIARSARRQIALLFGLLDSPMQPTQELTKLLASVDNGSITKVELLPNVTSLDPTLAYSTVFPPSPAGQTAQGQAVFRATGQILRLEIENEGNGYSNPPTITIAPPKNGNGTPALAKAKVKKGKISAIQLTDPGSGYTNDETISISISSPDGAEGSTATLIPILAQTVERIEITKQGSGYAAEKPLRIFLEPITDASSTDKQTKSDAPIQIGQTRPVAEKTSFTAFRTDSDKQKRNELEADFEKRYNLPDRTVTGAAVDGDAAALPVFGANSKSAELLRLLPSGIGLEYDSDMKRYNLAADTEFLKLYPSVAQPSSNRPIFPEFGPRARAPIERDRQLGVDAYVRFALSGAICSSGVHLALTPIDVVKTKVQTNPVKYPSIGSAFGTVYQEEGATTFFSGYVPTFLGNFLQGGVLYALTEIIRRSLSEAAGVEAGNLEVPIILIAAAIAAACGAALICPFEAVRIRTVAEPDYAKNSVGVVTKMIEEEGFGTLVNAIPVFLVRNIPYAMTKFTVFDISTERMYEAFPAATEELRLSLLVSLIGGILGGSAAALISNPADAVISELKKSKTDISPLTAVNNLRERAGVSAFFVGLPLRMFFYSLVASLSFVVYDAVRFALGIGSDDLKLYLDVLGGALGATTGSSV